MKITDLLETQRMSAAAKLQRAWEREQQKSAASAKRGREYMDQIKKDVADKDKKKDVAESKERCPQCGMTDCTCSPGQCKCKPIAGWIPNKGFKKDVEEGNNYHANTTGFSKPKRDDDEHHHLDVPKPTIYGLKINGQIWKKDGHVVTFATREKALAARNSLLTRRPELEVGLVQKGSAMESATAGATGSGSIASVAMSLGGKKKKKGGAVNLLGGPVFKR